MVSAVTPVWSDTKNTALAATFPLPCRGWTPCTESSTHAR